MNDYTIHSWYYGSSWIVPRLVDELIHAPLSILGRGTLRLIVGSRTRLLEGRGVASWRTRKVVRSVHFQAICPICGSLRRQRRHRNVWMRLERGSRLYMCLDCSAYYLVGQRAVYVISS